MCTCKINNKLGWDDILSNLYRSPVSTEVNEGADVYVFSIGHTTDKTGPNGSDYISFM